MFKEHVVIPIYIFFFSLCPVILRSLQSETYLIPGPVPKAHSACTHHYYFSHALLCNILFRAVR